MRPMTRSGTHHATLYIGWHEIDVAIRFLAHPGEPMVRYYPDGSGHPGMAPFAELDAVSVTAWHVDDDTRKRDDHWVWDALDAIAFERVEDDWDAEFETLCLEDAEAD